MKRPRYFGGLVAFIILLLLPAASRLLVGLAESIGNCRVEPGLTSACLIGGADWSVALQQLTAISWLALFTVPLAALLVLLVVFQLVSEARR